jgi:surfactin synthase thioesterase subunit
LEFLHFRMSRLHLGAPARLRALQFRAHLDDVALTEALGKLGGVPEEMLANPKLLLPDIFPVVRRGFALIERRHRSSRASRCRY